MTDGPLVRPSRRPWEIFPALTDERLRVPAAIIRDIRADIIQHYEPSKGDMPWSLACFAYPRILKQIETAAGLPEYPWLSIVERDGLAFTFGIGGIPIKFVSGDPEHPSERALHRRLVELEAYYEAIGYVDDPTEDHEPGRVFRLIVTIRDLLVDRVTLVQLDARGGVHNPYPISLDAVPAIIRLDTKSRAIEVPPLTVPRKRDTSDRSTAKKVNRE